MKSRTVTPARKLQLQLTETTGRSTTYTLTGRIDAFFDEIESCYWLNLGAGQIQLARFLSFAEVAKEGDTQQKIETFEVDGAAWDALVDPDILDAISRRVAKGQSLESAVRLQVDVFDYTFTCRECNPPFSWTDFGTANPNDMCGECGFPTSPETKTQVGGLVGAVHGDAAHTTFHYCASMRMAIDLCPPAAKPPKMDTTAKATRPKKPKKEPERPERLLEPPQPQALPMPVAAPVPIWEPPPVCRVPVVTRQRVVVNLARPVTVGGNAGLEALLGFVETRRKRSERSAAEREKDAAIAWAE